jgi:GNAT superfamily N-acetyltransferase
MLAEKGGVRAAQVEDLKEVLALINIPNRLFYKAIVPPERFKDPFLTEAELREEFQHKDFYVYELAGRLVGVAALEAARPHLTKVGIVTRMYVLPEFQRRGIGSALIREIERRAKWQGLRELLIWTDPKAEWAVSFYKKAGYEELDPATRYGDEAVDARITEHRRGLLVLRKEL